MAEEREVKIKIGVEAPKGDGFKKLAEDAKKAHVSVEERLKKIQQRIDGIGFKSAARDEFDKFLGLSKAHRQMDRFAQNFEDNVKRMRKAMAAGADELTLARHVNRLHGDVTKMKGAFTEMAGAAASSFARAGDGVSSLARGMAVLGGGSLDKVIEKMLIVGAVMDTARGVKDIGVGIYGGVQNARNARNTLQTVRGASSALQTVGNIGAAAAGTAVLGGAAKATGAWGAIKGGATAVGGLATGAGIAAGIGGGLALAVGGGALMAGLAPGWTGRRLNDLGFMDNIPDASDAKGIAKLRNQFRYADNPWQNPSLSEEEKQKIEASRLGNVYQRERMAKLYREAGLGDPDADARYEREAPLRNAAAAGRRELGNRAEHLRLGAAASRFDRQYYGADVRSQDRMAAYGEATAAAMRPDAAPGAFARLSGAARGLVGAEQDEAPGTAATRQAMLQAELERGQALRHVEEIQRRIAAANKADKKDTAEKLDLQKQLVQAQMEMGQATEKQVAVNKAHADTERGRLENQRKFAAEQAQAARQLVEAEKERLKGQKEQFGFMDPEKKLEALRISRKVKAGGELTREDAEMVGGIGVFGDEVRKQSLRNAERDPFTREIFANMGADAKLRDLQAGAANFEKLKIELTQKVEASFKIGEESIAAAVQRDVVPVITKALSELAIQLKMEINRNKDVDGIIRRMGGPG